MRANNSVTLIGRAGSDAEIRYLPSGAKVANFNMAVETFKRDDAGNKISEWYPITLWERQAELSGDMVKKGDLLAVNGSLETQEWEKDGQKQKKVQIRASAFQILRSAGDGQGQSARRTDGRPVTQAGRQAAYQQATEAINKARNPQKEQEFFDSYAGDGEFEDDMPF